MKKMKFLLLSTLVVLMAVTSCKKDDPVNEAEVLAQHIESYITPKTLASIISAADLSDLTTTNGAYIIDIRSANDYAAGHIQNAVNVPVAADILPHVESNAATIGTKPIVMVCYTGQSAAWATALLRVAGYSNTKSLGFGMSSWTTAAGYDKWTANISDLYATQLSTTATAMGPEGNLPALSTGFENGEDILDARLDDIFSEGFSSCGVTAAEVFANKDNDNYYIVNYWPKEQYDLGHIPNAINYQPADDPFTLANELKTLPAAQGKTIVVYCYTGQGSAFLTAYLRLLGYNCKSLLFGANAMFNSTMPGTRWPITVTDRPVVTK